MLYKELANELTWGRVENREQFRVALQERFPISAEEKVDEVQSVTESYHKYKHEYVKHLSFNVDNKKLSK